MLNKKTDSLTVAERNRINELKKVDPLKAARLQRRLRNRKRKKDKPETGVRQALNVIIKNEANTEEVSQEEEEDYIVPDLTETLTLIGHGAEDAAENLSEIEEVYKRFAFRDETRAAGKGSAIEELLESDEARARAAEERKKKELICEDEDDEEPEPQPVNRHGLSKKKIKQMKRPTISYLKQICCRPEVVETWDTTAPDPSTLVHLKAYRNTVTVPPHWSHKRRYLQGKRGIERSQFALPSYIEATKISEIRSAIEEKDSKKTLKQKMREKSRPRHRKMNIDYQTLHDAFFKHASKPGFTRFGDIYFEGKETEMHFRRYTPGRLSERCREALGLTSALDAPPWLLNMQRYGPPPSYPNIICPGVNAHIPEGAALGYQPGGWGKPPSLDQLAIWGVTPRFEEVILGEDDHEGLDEGIDGGLWGTLQLPDSDDELLPVGEEGDEEMEEEEEPEGTETPMQGMAARALLDLSGTTSIVLASAITAT